MTGSETASKLYYIELLKERFPEDHAELMKVMAAERVEPVAEETPPKQKEATKKQ